ncbi:MAG: hypothetical protein IJM45_05035 [Clostridia bacterium]|nr:hypothetical protein [Clostridia bacterium]
MSKPMKKGVKIFLVVLIVLVLVGLCFASVAIYARMQFNKEKSWLPPVFTPQQASVTELPDNAHDAYAYVIRLYEEAVRSDAAEGSWRTDVDLGGEVTLPFADADKTLFDDIRSGAAEAVKALYPTVSGVKMSEEAADDIPAIDFDEADILEYVYDPAAIFNRKGEYVSDAYDLTFKLAPVFESRDDIEKSAVFKGACDAMQDALTVNDAELDVKEAQISFRVDRLTDKLQSVVITRTSVLNADVALTDAYSALLADTGSNSLTVDLPYKTTEHIDFTWYGLHFSEDYIEQQPDDIIALPIDVKVNGAAVSGEDFELTYEISDPETLSIDDDNVLTVKKTNDVSDTEGIKVTAVLSYQGKTYTDDLIVYITELDKTETGVRFWQDGFTLSAGSTEALPVEIRVPINEQSELKTEEEYELFVDVSDPSALTVEVDGKDLYATGLKASADPVTVSVTLKCGGHTYEAQLPVTITMAKEAENDG